MTGRNETCPCGSGKKYKKCCLSKDQESTNAKIQTEQLERAAAALAITNSQDPAPKLLAPPSVLKPARPLDPHQEAVSARWNEFGAADDEGKRDLFIKTIDEPDLMDDEMAFQMLSAIYDAGIASGHRDQCENLVDLLKDRLPEIYSKSRKYYLLWRISNARAMHQSERLRQFACEIAETAGDDVDAYHQVVVQLAYHGELAVLSAASHIAWPLIKTSTEILWGQDDYSRWGADCVLFEQFEKSRRFDVRDPILIEKIRFFFENLDIEQFQQLLLKRSGQANRSWSLDDFQLKSKHQGKRQGAALKDSEKKADSAKVTSRGTLSDLMLEFVDYARHQEGVSYTRAELAKQNIQRYLLDRDAGKLAPGQDLISKMTNRGRKPKPQIPDHPLCPDRDTIDRFLAKMLDLMRVQIYDVAATFELIPTWLRFLETRGLIEPSKRLSTIANLHELHGTLMKLYETERADMVLQETFRQWPEHAARPVPVTLRNVNENVGARS